MAYRRRRRIVPWIIAAVVLVAAGGGWLYWAQNTHHPENLPPGALYRCGLQSFREFENAVRRVKPRTIVTLVDDRELADPEKPQFKREIDSSAGSGVNVVRVPIPLGGWPEGDEVERFLAIAQN